jgi:hypothetical protein
VRIGEFAWSHYEPRRAEFAWGWLDRAMEILGSAGLKIVLGTPTAAPPKWLMDEFPEIAPIDEEGRPRGFGSRRHYTFSSQAYWCESARIIEALAHARIERVPPTAQIGLEPAGEIHWAIRRRHTYVPKIAGAISRWDFHAAAECDGEMRVVAAHPLAFIEHFPRGHRGARMFIAECNVSMHEIADRLDARPSGRRFLKEAPGGLGQTVGFVRSARFPTAAGSVRQCRPLSP